MRRTSRTQRTNLWPGQGSLSSMGQLLGGLGFALKLVK